MRGEDAGHFHKVPFVSNIVAGDLRSTTDNSCPYIC